MAPFPFVGRSAELETLRSLIPRAEADAGRVALLGGEAGSGKSRLVRELSAQAAADGVLVLYGACDAVVRTPYGPFVEALSRAVHVIDASEVRAALGTTGGELTRLLPDLPALVGELPAPVKADPDTERHRLHTAVADLLMGISRERPVLLVLEDGHWADTSTLLLLRYLARAATEARLLVLATFRDTDADVPQALSEALADLRRSDAAVRLHLAALSHEEIAEFVARAAGVATGSAELAQAIAELTGGNAFLVCELWRALVETGAVEVADGELRLTRSPADLGTPDSVREVVSERVARLGAGTSALLQLAATAGGEFELDVIRRAAQLDDAELLASLDEAVRSGMIEELESRTLAYRFTHELVRRALYDRLTGVRRAELHLRVGEALEDNAPPGVLAHHFTAAAPLGGTPRAVDHNLRAGRAAIDALAFDEAMARLRSALALEIARTPRRAAILLDLGTAAHRAGKSPDALEAFRDAAQISRDLGDADLLARAAIGYEDACWRPGMAEAGAAELLEEAATTLGDHDSALRVRVLSGLTRALDFRGDHQRAAVVRASAVEMARRLEDRRGLADLLMGGYWSRGTLPPEEVLVMLDEAVEIAAELGDTELRAEAMCWRVPSFVALGEMACARGELAALQETAQRTAQPFVLYVAAQYDSTIALCDGRLELADAEAQRSREWSRLLTGRDASGTYGIQMFGVRREQGRLAELAPVIRLLAGRATRSGPWRPGLVSVLVELGMEAEARRELARVGAEGLDALRESPWLASLAFLTDAAAALGDEATAALVYPELEPLAGGFLVIGQLVACYGAADRYLGMLAATLGDWERAEDHFERAAALNRRTGMVTWLAHTLYQQARARLARRDRAGAAEPLTEAADLAQRTGLPALLARTQTLGAAAPAALPDGLSAREVQILALVARGLSNREIGGTLSISEHTAANHVRSILRKTGSANRTQAASYAHRQGLVAG